MIKDPRQSLFLDAIAKDFIDARFIFQVRDVRAVAMSVMFSKQPLIGFKKWYEYNHAVRHALQKVSPQQAILVRYEDMVSDPEKEIGRLVEFLGYRLEPPMLNYGNFPHADDNLLLWNGPPAESLLHSTLQQGSISEGLVKDRDHFSGVVTDIYNKLPEIRKLNQMLGYS